MQTLNKIINTWLDTKICLPNEQRGLVFGKVRNLQVNEYSILLTQDSNFLVNLSDYNKFTTSSSIYDKFNQKAQFSETSLYSLPEHTVIMIIPPRTMSNVFWFGKIKQLIAKQTDSIQQFAEYSLLNLHEVKNIDESRQYTRTLYRTLVELQPDLPYRLQSTLFYTRDISIKGLSLVVNKNDKCPFEIDKEYTFNIHFHESDVIKELRYTCRNIRNDIISQSRILGFELSDDQYADPDIQNKLNLLSWINI